MTIQQEDSGEICTPVDFFSAYIKKHSRSYVIMMAMIILFEIVMIVRAAFRFDLSNHRHLLYLASYILLLLASAAGLYGIDQHSKGRVSAKGITIALHSYCTMIILWSLIVSWLDLSADGTPIVYLTVIMAISGLTVVYPLYYMIAAPLSFLALLSFNLAAELRYFTESGSGLYFNLVIVLLVSLVIAIHHYRVSYQAMAMSQHLHRLSYTDQLTGLYNRRMFEQEMQQISDKDRAAAIGVIDLDHFKQINDKNGHDFGDACLIKTGELLRENFGERAYRIGGDEFIVITGNMDQQSAREGIDRINRGLEAAFPGKSISLCGGFRFRAAGSGAEGDDLIHAADQALYRAKAAGGRQCCFAGE